MAPERLPASGILAPMEIRNEFTVAAPADDLWAFLLDVEKIAPCMPGAELTEVVDAHTWKGRMTMKFGPVSMAFAGTVTEDERDDAEHKVKLTAKGTEQKGKGAANASVTSWLEPGPGEGETTVQMLADITITGAAAQMSRGLLPEISKKLTQQFADCLKERMSAEQAATDTTPATPGAATAPSAPTPVGGIGLGMSALWAVIRAFFSRLFGGEKKA